MIAKSNGPIVVSMFVGCAPPVGSYDPKLAAKRAGGIIDKSERFRPPKGNSRDISIQLNVNGLFCKSLKLLG